MFNPDFSLTQYMDAEMTDPADADDETELGAVLYFKLTMDNPIENVTFVIDGNIIFFVSFYPFFYFRLRCQGRQLGGGLFRHYQSMW